MKDKVITINPLSRVEGHAKVIISLDEEKEVKEAKFCVTSLRGFEKFCEGHTFWEMPIITSRICGICPVSHLLASAKTGDAILGVEIPPTAKMLRELMHMGQFIHSHSLHFFFLACPDLFLGMDFEPAKRNFVGLLAEKPDIVKVGVKMRAFGQEIIATVGGGRKVHPIIAIPGGMTAPLLPQDRDKLLNKVDGVISDVESVLGLLKDFYAKEDWVKRFANFPSGYLGLVANEGDLELYDGKLRLKGKEGELLEEKVDPSQYLSIIEERVEDFSYLKSPYYKKVGYPAGMYRVGPLGRLNVADRISTPLANKELSAFRKMGENGVVQGTMYYHFARLTEVLYAAEKAKMLLQNDDICGKEIRTIPERLYLNEEGVGVIEAPRGTLFHHYWVDKLGTIRKVNLIVATGNNNLAMNRAAYEVAKEYIKDGKFTEGALNRVEAAIRCFDPCISCSVHAMGWKYPLIFQLVSPQGEIIEEVKDV